MLAGAGFVTVMFLIPAHAVTLGMDAEEIGFLLGLANGSTVLGAILLHHFIKNYGRLNAMVLIHGIGGMSCVSIWYNSTTYNSLALFTSVFSMSVGSLVPMYPMGELESEEKESWILGLTQVMKWAMLTTAVAIPIVKVLYVDWAMKYLTPYWVRPAISLVASGYISATIGLIILRFSMSPYLRAKL